MQISLIGYGLENESAYNYLKKKFPHAEFTVYDQAAAPAKTLAEGVSFVGSLDSFDHVQGDIIVRSPGISIYKLPTHIETTSATEIFFEQCSNDIIGVTGSKGKGTTCSLIDAMLRSAGKRTWLVGNIGKPALDILDQIEPGDVIVYELSSFQLWDISRSPQTAVVLMIEPEHLEVHKDFQDYLYAKSNIGRFQSSTDTLIFNSLNDYSISIANASKAKKIAYPSEENAHVVNERIYYGDQEICPVNFLNLPGEHNIGNALAAIDAAWPYVTPASIIDGLKSFKGLPHRLKFVRELNGVSYYDDSIATTPGSAIAAIRAFESSKVLILGGSSKNADFTELSEVIANNEIRKVLLIGQEASKIKSALDDAGYDSYIDLGSEVSMSDILSSAQREAQEGDIVILSPACASFGMFKNYADRGDKYIAAVEGLQ